MVVVMRTHTSCHHHRCNLWTKTANINITIIDIHITASTSILSLFLATDALQLENGHHHLLRDSPQTLSSLLDCLTLHSHHLSCPPCRQHFCSILWTLCLANHHILVKITQFYKSSPSTPCPSNIYANFTLVSFHWFYIDITLDNSIALIIALAWNMLMNLLVQEWQTKWLLSISHRLMLKTL